MRVVETYATIAAERAARIDGWFTDHVAAMHRFASDDGRVIEELRWRKPGTSIYSITYLCRGGHLIVTGDVGDAIYLAGGQGLEFWAACSLDYFAGKCIASPYGRGFRAWDERIARIYLAETFAEDEKGRACRFGQLGGWEAIDSKAAWIGWVGVYGWEVWGDYSELGSVGETVDQACEAHLRGLKMALAQGRTPRAAQPREG